MKRRLSDRFLSALLSLVMIFSSVPSSAIAETLTDDETPEVTSYYLFIDQQLEFGSITDKNEEKEYFEVYSDAEVEEDRELMYKSTQYEEGSEIELKVTPEEGYALVEALAEKYDTEEALADCHYDEETNILKFTMPSANVLATALFEKIPDDIEPLDNSTDDDTSIEEGSEEPVEEGALDEVPDESSEEEESQNSNEEGLEEQSSDDGEESDIYIKSFSTQLYYGVDDNTEQGNVWTATNNNSGHRFLFRLNYSISGVGSAPAGYISFVIPRSILVDRDGNSADGYEMSVPSKADVDAFLDGTGEPIDTDVGFAYYEDGDNIVIYNFSEISAGTNGYIELCYFTSLETYYYVDMAESKPFTAQMITHDESVTADPITVKINTNSEILSSEIATYPTKHNKWQDSWGLAAKPENPENYHYLVWTMKSNISTTQMYNFTLSNALVSNLGGMEVLAYKFAGQEEYGTEATIENQTLDKYRYDYIIVGIPLDIYHTGTTFWKVEDTITATVDPVDNVDEDTSSSSKSTWQWEKPTFSYPGGRFNAYKRADGAYRTYYEEHDENSYYYFYWNAHHSAPSLDFSSSYYSRYDLETFNGYDGAEISNTVFGGFEYATWIIGFPYPWTVDGDKDVVENYGKIPVSYELIDEGVCLTADNNNDADNSELLTSEDFEFTSLRYSWKMRDAVLNEETQRFEDSGSVTYTDNDILVFYGKFGTSTEFVEFARLNLKTNGKSFDNAYVASMTNSEIVFKDNAGLIAYKITTSNAHFYTEIFTVPTLTLKNSDRVVNYVNGKPSIGIRNTVIGHAYDNSGNQLFENIEYDTEYARVSKRFSEIEKDVTSVYNNTKNRQFVISWKVEQSETMQWGDSGEIDFIPQNGGTFYDLLPEGSILNKSTIDVATSNGRFLNESSYTVRTIENYKNTGRTMLIVEVKVSGEQYILYYDTNHPWNNIHDYGPDVYNPVVYRTGNNSITGGFPDNGGQYYVDGTENAGCIGDADLVAGLTEDTSDDAGVARFIFGEKYYNIPAITAASSGLTKKAKGDKDTNYIYQAKTGVDTTYSYQLRYMNSYTSAAKDMIFFDSLENYDPSTKSNNGTERDWHGTLQSIDVNQLIEIGIAPVIYYSTISNLDIETNNDLSNSSVWAVLTDTTDLSQVKAIAIDMRKNSDGEDFVLGPGKSAVAFIYMSTPTTCPDTVGDYARTYNNVYVSNTVLDTLFPENSQSFLIHQDYTEVKLLATGSFGIDKVSTESENIKVPDIKFSLRGTSDYGTKVDVERTTDAMGQIYFENLEKGTYILQEYESPADWLLDPTERRVVIDNSGKVWIDGEEYTSAYITIANIPRIHGDFSFYKKELGSEDVGIAGTTFRISGRSDYGTEILMYATSAIGGKVEFLNVEKGTYDLVEVSANDSYQLNDIVYKITIDEFGFASIVGSNETDENGDPVSLEDSEWYGEIDGKQCIFNAYRFYQVKLRKVDIENETIFLEGAEFTLLGTSDLGNEINLRSASDANGLVVFKGVEKGTYILTEEKAPQDVTEDGKAGGNRDYLLDTTQYIVEVDYIGNVTIDGVEREDGTGYFVFKNARAYDKQIVITKIWNDGLTNEERIEQGLIPKLHLTTRDLTQDSNFHTHTWDNGILLSVPSCSKAGETMYTCTACGMSYIEKETLEHTYGEGVRTKEPTCTEEGVLTFTCEDCGYVYNTPIAKLPHPWDDGVVQTPATCSAAGEMLHTCTVCGETKVEPIAMLPHTWSDKTCTVCGLTLKYNSVVMTGPGSTSITVSNANYDRYVSNLRPYYSKIITFIPTESRTYSFTINPGVYMAYRLFDENLTSLTYKYGYYSTISYSLTAGKVYYFALGQYNSTSTAKTMTVTIK